MTTSQSEIGLFCGVYCPILGQSVKEDKLAGPIKSKLYDKSRILSGCVTFYSVRHEILALFVCISLDICHSSNNFWTSMDHGHLNPKICMGHFGCFDLLVIMWYVSNYGCPGMFIWNLKLSTLWKRTHDMKMLVFYRVSSSPHTPTTTTNATTTTSILLSISLQSPPDNPFLPPDWENYVAWEE